MGRKFLILLSVVLVLTYSQEQTKAFTAETTAATVPPSNVSSKSLKPTYTEYNFTDCSESNLDECGKVIFLFGNQNLYLPTSRKQIKPFCRMQKSGAKCILEWGKSCLTSFPRQALLMMVRGVNKNLKERCSKDGADLYVKNKSCLRKSAKGLNKCMMQFRDDLSSVTTHPVRSEWLGFICCSIEKWNSCFNHSVAATCDADGLQYLKSSAETYISELNDVVCSGKRSVKSEQCDAIATNVRESKDKFDRENNSMRSNPQSVILPMFKIVTSYTENQSKLNVLT